MTTLRYVRLAGAAALALASCKSKTEPAEPAADGAPSEARESPTSDAFSYTTGDRFGDSAILRYRVPGFEDLDPEVKELLYYLSEAALAGRDITYDQNYRHNLAIRRTVEAILEGGETDLASEEGQQLMTYAKKIWFANGLHHHYSSDKFLPEFGYDWFAKQVKALSEAALPLVEGETADDLLAKLKGPMFDPEVDAKRVNKAEDVDPVKASANNFYAPGITEEEVQAFYDEKKDPDDETPVSYGLNSKLVKEDGELKERVWKIDGMYGEAIERIVFWLEKAITVAENEKQRKALEALV